MTSLEVVTSPPRGREERIWRALARLAETPPTAEEARIRPVEPGFAEHLVFEFDEAYTSFVEGFEVLPSEAQLLALQAVDTQVSTMVGARDKALWTEEARRQAPHWEAVRRYSNDALSAFGWPLI